MTDEGSLALSSGVRSLSEGSLGVGSFMFCTLMVGSYNEDYEGSRNDCYYIFLIVV